MSRVSGRAGVPLHQHLTRRGARKLVPSLRKDALVGALKYYDAQVDDARHTMFIARTAAAYGAHVASRARVVELVREGERVTGAVVRDLETDTHGHASAPRQVVNATGVWTDETQALGGQRGEFHVRASKGVHLVVPKDRIRSEVGLILRTEKSVLFVIPWGRHWIIGTTDTDWSLDKAHPAASEADIDYLLEHVNAVLETPLTRADVEGVYAGLRPLLEGESEATSKLSREHAVGHPAPGLVVVAGGKYTTYRIMAKDAVDEAVFGLDVALRPQGGPVGHRARCRCWAPRATRRCATPATCWPSRSGLHEVWIEHLLDRYGSLVHELLDLVAADPSLGEPLAGGAGLPAGRGVYAASHEGARHLDDVLTRRTRLSIETFDRGVGAVEEVADAGGAGARVERGAAGARGRALPQAGRGRAREPADARRRDRRRRPPRRGRRRAAQ